MKKNLKLIVFTIVLCAVSILNVKVMLDIDYSNDLLMTSLVSVSRGEGDRMVETMMVHVVLI